MAPELEELMLSTLGAERGGGVHRTWKQQVMRAAGVRATIRQAAASMAKTLVEHGGLRTLQHRLETKN